MWHKTFERIDDTAEEKEPQGKDLEVAYYPTPLRRKLVESEFAEAIDSHQRLRGMNPAVMQRVFVEGNPNYIPTDSTSAPGRGFFPLGVGSMAPNAHKTKVVDMSRYNLLERLRTTEIDTRVSIPLASNEHAPVLVSYKERNRRNMGPSTDLQHAAQPSHPSFPTYGRFGGEVYRRK